jgi:hypothetical protein
MIVDLIILIVAGVIGGNAIGKSLPKYDLGAVGNTIAGAIGGIGGGLILQVVALAIAGGGLALGVIGPLIGGGVGGAILTIVTSNLKSRMANK